MISHEGYCGLYIQVHVRDSPFPAARPQSNVHRLTHGAHTIANGTAARYYVAFRYSERVPFQCAHVPRWHSHARTTSCDYFTFQPTLKGNEFANMLIFDSHVLRDFFALIRSFTSVVLYISHFSHFQL